MKILIYTISILGILGTINCECQEEEKKDTRSKQQRREDRKYEQPAFYHSVEKAFPSHPRSEEGERLNEVFNEAEKLKVKSEEDFKKQHATYVTLHLLKQAKEMHKKKDYETAIIILEDLVKEYPENEKMVEIQALLQQCKQDQKSKPEQKQEVSDNKEQKAETL